MKGALLVAGTTSDAGKSILTAGICRWLARQGVSVAPFKAQNMSNNSAVTPDGGEIGRAQALQAAACGLEASVRFNPVLLKPGSDHSSQVVVLGQPYGHVDASNYRQLKGQLSGMVFDTLAELRADHDVVICEGAGSPAEINLRAGDFVNMGLARAADLPTIVVGDIDRGGVFAALYGTLALLDAADQALIRGFVINKFRGARSLLEPGLEMLRERTDRPVLGVLPFSPDLWLDGEDSLSYRDGAVLGRPRPPAGAEGLTVAVVRLPRISNATDAEALAAEPGVTVRLTSNPAEVAAADLAVLPGSKATVADLAWLREFGLDRVLVERVRAGRPVFGICGGYQMMSRTIHDDVESRAGDVPGLGLLPVDVTFAAAKTLSRPVGEALGSPVTGYEIHHGQAVVDGSAAPLITIPGGGEGVLAWPVAGTHWHGLLENDAFRRAFLVEVAGQAGRDFTPAPDTDFAGLRSRQLDLLGDLVAEYLDGDLLSAIIEGR
ncbi:cobyric acid synthase [Longispora fulva]|uniref:Cobyric acid synthase n=1 Tax=Longispora fulva TaxID=619741 RepID=A0A8J7GJR9_9ACTN|nr:cobyric acid synthase [Longispora fulva]MBG6140709.1 adenosylcobyric acid synthase [Longispora fulva]GIG61027.1 cobyric acid synthase [Longispora fulva]